MRSKKRKPSDTPERRKERVHLHRRRGVFKRISDAYIALPRQITTLVIDRMIANDIADIDLVSAHIRDEFDLREMLNEQWGISGVLRCEPHWLAKGAYQEDRERIERETRQRASKDARGWKKGVWTRARAGEPWSNRFGRRELAADDFAELWALNKRITRFSPRRKLRMKDGTFKTEIIAPGSVVRRPPLSAFEASRVFPVGKQWFRRLDWSQSKWMSKPATCGQLGHRVPLSAGLPAMGSRERHSRGWQTDHGLASMARPKGSRARRTAPSTDLMGWRYTIRCHWFLIVREGKGPMTHIASTHHGLIQFELPRETIEQIDRLARAETISRAAWIRRLLIGVAREHQPQRLA
jgi:hypothetical protein